MGLNHTSESKVIAIWICLEFLSLISSVLIYYWSQSDILVESYGRLNLPWASKFNFECLNILCNRIRHPSEKLWPFEFIENFHFSISSFSIFRSPQSYTRVKNYDHLNLPCASMFNFKHLDILCNRIRHPSEMLWPFEFCESLRCSIFSVSIYHGPQSYSRVKSYGRLNLPRAFVLNIECPDILCVWIGHLSEKLWPFEIPESFRCSILSVSIYHWPQSYTRVKSYGHLNMPRAYLFKFKRVNIWLALITHPSKKLWLFKFAQSFCVQFRASQYIIGLNHTFESKVMAA